MCPDSCRASRPEIMTHASVCGACGLQFKPGFVPSLCGSSDQSWGGGAALSPILQMRRPSSESSVNVSEVTQGPSTRAGIRRRSSAET